MKLVMLIGIPGAGKTTSAFILSKYLPNSIIVNLDDIRKELYGDISILGNYNTIKDIAHKRILDAISKDINIILDTTNTDRKIRKESISTFHNDGINSVIGIWIDTPISICIERNLSRTDRKTPVLERYIYTMHDYLSKYPPLLEDGFDKYYRIDTSNKSLLELEDIYKDIIL